MKEVTRQSQNKFSLSMPVQYLKGVGPARAKVFAQMGIESVGDLLEYFPRDWQFVPEGIKISQMREGEIVSIVGVVEMVDFQRYSRSQILEASLADDTGVCRIVWFHGGYLAKQIEPGMVLMLSGKVSIYKHQLQLTNPKFKVVSEEDISGEDVFQVRSREDFGGGVYPACAKLSSRQIKKIIRPVLDDVEGIVDEFYDKSFLKKAVLIGRSQAFKWIHMPPDEEKLAKAKRRLKYDELFLMQLGLALRRYRRRHFSSAPVLVCNERIERRIRKRFPFLLTSDQNEVIEEIVSDMGRREPMNRLLQGDVASGKTVAALYAALVAVANGWQVAIMAPTEILANQHFISIERYLKNSNVQIKAGEIDIVVGTVALLQKDVKFNKLGLVVIDEQHKFGVEQRAQLRKSTTPHCLVMTATPIPRTLAMTAFGDLDISVIKHSPPGRGTCLTRWVDRQNQAKAEEFIRQRLKAKKQAYFVYPRIENTEEASEVRAATEEWKKLREVFCEFKVELLHGQMPSAKKQRIMTEFRRGKIDVLVSTIVIEVGVDVPNATIMVIEGADRFGLAQLHQLRGRISRGEGKSYCFLFAETDSETAKSRLEVMTRSRDGFEIAEYDLRLRGPGELFSTRQHGLPGLKIANIIDDYELLVMARRNAFELVKKDAMLKEACHRNIRQALLAKFGDSLGLADVA
ncbi:MAG: ATP-dependent DNA helicase RecG [Planctomycetota bacterium]|jgi:ATP-dependent DNA helicase RecG